MSVENQTSINEEKKVASLTLKTEKAESCPCCQASNLHSQRFVKTTLLNIDWEFRRCGVCRSLYLDPMVANESIGELYTSCYAPYATKNDDVSNSVFAISENLGITGRFAIRISGVVRRVFKRTTTALVCPELSDELNSIQSPNAESGIFLDFGCGNSIALDSARQFGWKRTIGVDFNQEVVHNIRKRGHEAVMVESVDSYIDDCSVNMIRMNHVIEHIACPKQTLSLLYKKLIPGGVIHLGTPNGESLSLRIFGRHWLGLDWPRHVCLFTPKSLATLVSEVGFSSVKTFQEPAIQDLIRSVAFWCGIDRKISRDFVITTQRDNGLAPIVWGLARLGKSLGRCERFHVVAKKS